MSDKEGWSNLRFIMLIIFFTTNVAFAARNATVVSEKAVIWADAQRTTPLGYAVRGKIIRVGEIQREKNQVLPVIVSGKIGYISVEDIIFSSEDRKRAIEQAAESRFEKIIDKKNTQSKRASISGFNTMAEANETYYFDREDTLKDFVGIQLRADLSRSNENFMFGLMLELKQSTLNDANLRVFSLGFGGSWSMINARYFKFKLESFLMAVPYAGLQEGKLFTVNGYGAGALGQATVDLMFTQSWGITGSAGFEATKLFGFNIPAPFNGYAPWFIGPRASAGIVRYF
jgi:hypothetical protein